MSALPIESTSPAVSKVLVKVDEIAVLPQVVYKVVEITGASESSAQMIEKAILVDPGFSAKVLAQANSAFYGLPRKVTSIREAVMFLGFRAVRQLAMTVGVFDLFVGKSDDESLRRRAWWRHSVDTAVCCKFMSEQYKCAAPDEAYTCGLLHYIGKTLLDRYAPESYSEVQARIDHGMSDVEAESEVYGCHHVEVGVAVGERWGFPEVLIAGLEYVYEPSVNDPFGELMACVAISDSVATFALEGLSRSDLPLALERLPQWAVERLSLTVDDLESVIDGGTAAIARAASLQF